jgi:hypothetical protein
MPPAASWFLAHVILDPKDGGDELLRNVGSRTDYTALYSGRWQHSYRLLCESQMLRGIKPSSSIKYLEILE